MLSILREIINSDVEIKFSTDTKGQLILKENAEDSRIKILMIQNIPEESFAFTLDYQPKLNKRCFQQLSSYLNKSANNINKGCDLVLITFENSECKVLLLDLKSDKPNRKETETQLINSKLFVQYVFSMIQEYSDSSIDYSKISYYLTAVVTKPQNKKSTYSPNDKKLNQKNSIKFVPLMPKSGKVHTYLSALS